ncbi:MAG: hypothetical protein AB7E47_11445 [Desulfovibrionaceae bacterium]
MRMKGYDIFYRDTVSGQINRTRFSLLSEEALQQRLDAIGKKYQVALILRVNSLLWTTRATIHRTFDINDPLVFYYLGAEMSKYYAGAVRLKKELADIAARQGKARHMATLGEVVETYAVFREYVTTVEPGHALCVFFTKDGSRQCERQKAIFCEVVGLVPSKTFTFIEVPLRREAKGTTKAFTSCRIAAVPDWVCFYNPRGKLLALRFRAFMDKYILAQHSQGVAMKGASEADIKESFVQYIRWVEDKLGPPAPSGL